MAVGSLVLDDEEGLDETKLFNRPDESQDVRVKLKAKQSKNLFVLGKRIVMKEFVLKFSRYFSIFAFILQN